jgi:type II secretory pathway component PulJ
MHPTYFRAGFTLVEAMIAAGILVIVVAMTFEGMAASSRQQAMGDNQDELSDDARTIITTMNTDLAASGWHFADRVNADVLTADVGESTEQFLVYDPSQGGWNHNGIYQGTNGVAQDLALDRTRHYYPFISQQSTPEATPATEATRGLGAGPNATYPNRHSWAFTWRNTNLRWPGPLPADLPASAVGQAWSGPSSPGDIASTAIAAGSDAENGSFHARSRELIFLRTTVAGWKSDPRDLDQPLIGFRGTAATWKSAAATAAALPDTTADKTARNDLGILFISGWMADPTQPELLTYRTDLSGAPMTTYGAVLEAGMIETQANGSLLVRPKWETMSLRTTTVGGITSAVDPATNGLPSNLRAYTYAVVPAPDRLNGMAQLATLTSRDDIDLWMRQHDGRGMGRLVRAFSTPLGVSVPDRGEGVEPGQWISKDAATGIAMVVDRVLSDNVVRIVFTTRRHDAELQVNQIRVRIWLARRTSGLEGQDTVITRILQTDFFMGTRAGSNDVYYDSEALGPAVTFQP